MSLAFLSCLTLFYVAVEGRVIYSLVKAHQRLLALECISALDPAMLVGSQFALEQRWRDLVAQTTPLSAGVVRFVGANGGELMRQGALALRAVCTHGVDELYRGDSHVVILVQGYCEPDDIADFFLAELGRRSLLARIGWAYTTSIDTTEREGLLAQAMAACDSVPATGGTACRDVGPVEAPPGDKVVVFEAPPHRSALSTRREATSLSRAQLALLAGLRRPELIRDYENGRPCELPIAQRILACLSIVEQVCSTIENATRRALTPRDVAAAHGIDQAPLPGATTRGAHGKP